MSDKCIKWAESLDDETACKLRNWMLKNPNCRLLKPPMESQIDKGKVEYIWYVNSSGIIAKPLKEL